MPAEPAISQCRIAVWEHQFLKSQGHLLFGEALLPLIADNDPGKVRCDENPRPRPRFLRRWCGALQSVRQRGLEATEYPPWSRDNAFAFLEDRCKLSERLPGFVVEHHGELFGRWRGAIEAGELELPFSVTHVGAHADLGLGDYGYIYLISNWSLRSRLTGFTRRLARVDSMMATG
jgi:hypothetical protein